MKVVEFKFDLNEKVKDQFDDVCIIKMLGVDDGGVQYFVNKKGNSRWVGEYDLRKEGEK